MYVKYYREIYRKADKLKYTNRYSINLVLLTMRLKNEKNDAHSFFHDGETPYC